MSHPISGSHNRRLLGEALVVVIRQRALQSPEPLAWLSDCQDEMLEFLTAAQMVHEKAVDSIKTRAEIAAALTQAISDVEAEIRHKAS